MILLAALAGRYVRRGLRWIRPPAGAGGLCGRRGSWHIMSQCFALCPSGRNAPTASRWDSHAKERERAFELAKWNSQLGRLQLGDSS